MDLLTQGIAGSVLASAGNREKTPTYAIVSGFLAGLLPDADALIRSSSDPLLTLEFHRQFSHSLLFIPFGALLASLLLYVFFRNKLTFKRLYLYCLLGYSSAGLLDASTSFGTQLLWPLSEQRIAWNLVAIVDPVFTLGLLIFLVMGWRTRKRRYALIAIGYAITYLAIAFSQQQAASEMQRVLADERGHSMERHVVKPTLGNIMLWRSVYLHQGYYYVDAIRPAFIGENRVYPGKAIAAYRPVGNSDNSVQAGDILRFDTLSDGYLVIHPEYEQVIGDVRYAMLPNSVEPLWGIRLDPSQPDRHTTEALFRKSDRNTRQQFLLMLRGRPVKESQ